MTYTVKVIFDRWNVSGNRLDEDSVREGEIEAVDEHEAIQKYLTMFRDDEPTRRKITSVTVHEGKMEI
jgi:hypothetical protein